MEEYEKIILNRSDFISSDTPEEIALRVDFNSIPIVLTPFKSKCNDIAYSLDLFNKHKQNILRLTPTDFLKNRKQFSTIFLIGENLNLMKEFGYDESIIEIKKLGFYLISSECEYFSNPKPLILNKFYVDCSDELVFVSLFILFKVYKKIDIVTSDKLKTEIFCKAMKMDCRVFDLYDKIFDLKETVIIIQSHLEISAKKVVYVGCKPIGSKEIKMDYNKVSKYIYRIRDVLKSITKDVLKGKKEFNYGKFINVLK